MTDQMSHDGTPDRPRGRSLIVVVPRDPASRAAPAMPTFLAQLIACRGRLPGYRRARREEPGPATAAYDRASDRAAPAFDLSV